MSDFDAVLERLVTDPPFAAALAADPVTALAGYRLDPDEVQLLHSQVGGDAPTQRTVEVRANQSSMFGMLAPLAGMVGGLPGIGDHLADAGGSPKPIEGLGPAERSAGFGGPAYTERFGAATHAAGMGPATHAAGFGEAEVASEAVTGAGAAGGPVGGLYTGGHYQGGGLAGWGDEIGDAVGATGAGQGQAATPVPEGYRTGVDMDGDGRDDKHLLRGRADGGVDILVDANRDGRVDTIGHDDDADGLVESVDYDKNHDGTFEKHMYDDTGDGWLDRTVIDRDER